LLRWLAVGGHEQEPSRTKAARALARCPKTAARLIGLLRVLLGDVTGAAALLSKRPGITLTDPDHDAAIDAMRIACEKRAVLASPRVQRGGGASV
jgi:hypothetical protein